MFFILSKILLFLLMPFWWVVILFILMKLSKRPGRKKLWMGLMIVVLIVFTNPYLFRTAVSAWQMKPVTLPAGKVYDAGILLGGLSGYDKDAHGYFGNNADRFIQAANLYHQGIIKKIVISGGTGKLQQDEPAEAFFLKTQFLANGVKEADILLESRSRNTYENALYTKKIFDSLSLKPPYILITSAWHMPRSAKIFTKAGYQFIAYPCDYKVVPLNFSVENFVIPNIGLLNEWTGLLKEMIGLVAYQLTGKA